MDKKAMKLNGSKPKAIVFQDQTILVKNYLSQAEMESLIESYLLELVKNSIFNPSRAEMYLMMGILDTCTNIEVSATELVDGKESLLVLPDSVFDNYELYTEVIKNVKNYDYFRKLLDFTVQEMIEQRRLDSSIGKVLSEFLSKINTTLDTIINGNISEENVTKIKELLSEVNSSRLVSLSGVLEDVKKSSPRRTRGKSK